MTEDCIASILISRRTHATYIAAVWNIKASSSAFGKYCTGAEHVTERMVFEKDKK